MKDGRVVFVARSAPEDRIELELIEEHAQWARGRLRTVLEAGPDRRAAPCSYYERCGGCQLQHLTYKAQLAAKSAIVADALRRLGGIVVDPPPIEPAHRELGYRNRVSFVLRRHGERVVAGYHGTEMPGELIDIESCPLAEPAINEVWRALRSAWGPAAQRLPAGEELRLSLRSTSEGEVALIVEGGLGRGEPEQLLGEVGGLHAIWGLGAEGEVEWRCGAESLEDRWDSYAVHISGDEFVQVNREVSGRIDAYVLMRCGDVDGLRVADVYCGPGLRALALSRAGGLVTGIDRDVRAISTALRLAQESSLNPRFFSAPAEEGMRRVLPAHLAILNPPRRGLARAVVKALLQRPPERLIYVSCDPATLARDLQRLAVRFTLTDLHAFDMFPQTAHVETVATLERPADQASS